MTSKFIKIFMNIFFLFISKCYQFIFSRPWLQPFNDKVLELAILGRGYNSKINDELIVTKILNRFNPQLCIDVGANIGNYSRHILDFTNSNVIAFEPLPFTFTNLKKLENIYPGRLEAINMGLGNKEDHISLHYGENFEIASFSVEANKIDYVRQNNINKVITRVTTLDTFIKSKKNIERIDFIKIDTEGYEHEVLQGSRETLKKFKPIILQLEINWHHLFKSISLYQFSVILPEYKIYQLLPYGSGLVERDPNQPESNIHHFSNFLFVSNEVTL